MKKQKSKNRVLAVLLSFCLIFCMLPVNVLAEDQISDGAGFKLETETYKDGVLTVVGCVKLPEAKGISSCNFLLSWDSSKLTLLKKNDNNVTYIPSTTKQTYKLSIDPLLINGETESVYGIADADLYGKDDRAGFKINLYSEGGTIDSQKTVDWVKAFKLKFRVKGSPADASTVLDRASLRVADPVIDAEVIAGAFPANNNYCVQVTDAGNPSKIYSYGKMAGNTGGEATGMYYIMAAAGNNTATYPGSENAIDPVCEAPANVTATYGQKLSDITLTNPINNTEGTWSWMEEDQYVGDVKAEPNTFKAKFTPNDTDTYKTVENIDVNVTVNAKALTDVAVRDIADQEYTGSKIKPEVTVTGDGNKFLTADKDYTLTYGENKAVGTGSVTVTAKEGGNYTFDPVTKYFNIVRSLGKIGISGELNKIYDGEAVDVTKLSVYKNDSTGKVTYKFYTDEDCKTEDEIDTAPSDAGRYWVKAFMAEDVNYSAAVSKALAFEISRADITPAVNIEGWTYGDTANAPDVTGNTGNGAVTYEYKVKDAADSTYSAKVPSDAGNYTVRATVAQTANYNGNTAVKDFTILPKSIT